MKTYQQVKAYRAEMDAARHRILLRIRRLQWRTGRSNVVPINDVLQLLRIELVENRVLAYDGYSYYKGLCLCLSNVEDYLEASALSHHHVGVAINVVRALLSQHKPADALSYWWPKDVDGYAMRLHVIDCCIRELETNGAYNKMWVRDLQQLQGKKRMAILPHEYLLPDCA